ncbi:MDR family MFS transporter [Clostridium coskatii]|uniref:Antiseptic resistance protein n=1 Tax=Clostridium coskatii TaxID=1705578 RepID=A0A166UNJ4_9CLOT|nr:MDR family MFS transporter [Clostridium coskatii]OAA95091.1 Antiseptic resistance protein [Clostridium coskatii]OBR97561.1 antiseptic resistance protein [Clostridium coskatii]
MESKKIYTEKKPRYNAKAIMFVLLLGSFIALFNETILNVAFPKLMVEMHITATTAQWLTTGYVLVVGILVPVTAFLIHTFTTKQLFLSAMILFLIGTLCAVFSSTFTALLISRIIQALGTGMLIPIMMNSALIVTPPEKRGSIMGLCVCIITLGPALGPAVSGLLLQHFSWHSLFILLIPILLICIIGGYIYLENISVITKPKIDCLSILLSTIGFAGIIYSVSSAGNSNLLSTAAIFVIGFIALIFFGKRQLSLKQPILEIRSFKHPIFTIGVLLIILMQMFNFSINVILPLLLQNGLKTSSFTSAMAILPPILVGCVLTPFVGKIYDKIGGSILIPLGFLVACIFTFVLSRISPSTPIRTITLIYCAIMVGTSMSMSTTQTTSLSELSGKNQADGVAIVNTGMQIAGALGSALFVGVMTAYQNIYLKNMNIGTDPSSQVKAIYSGFNHSITVAAVLIGIGFMLSLILSKKSRTKNSVK